MRRWILGTSAVLLALLFLVPLLIFRGRDESADGEEQSETEEGWEDEGLLTVAGKADGEQAVRVLNGEEVQEMTLGEYLVGVVRAEVPASFEQEALRAQAVAARTYTLYKIAFGSSHGDGIDICTDSTCCQAWLDEDGARQNWGSDFNHYEAKIEDAVYSTDGQVMLYENQPVLAVFHAASSGLTRKAGDVWLYDLPYLQAVSSPENGDQIPEYYSRAEFTAEEFQSRVQEELPDADLSGEPETWLQDLEADSAGNVIQLNVGGVTVKGSTMRSILGLRSACFDWELEDGTFVFHVTGYGHGIGMSQYGANQMATEGSTWQEILQHYYTGVTIGQWALPERQEDSSADASGSAAGTDTEAETEPDGDTENTEAGA